MTDPAPTFTATSVFRLRINGNSAEEISAEAHEAGRSLFGDGCALVISNAIRWASSHDGRGRYVSETEIREATP